MWSRKIKGGAVKSSLFINLVSSVIDISLYSFTDVRALCLLGWFHGVFREAISHRTVGVGVLYSCRRMDSVSMVNIGHWFDGGVDVWFYSSQVGNNFLYLDWFTYSGQLQAQAML